MKAKKIVAIGMTVLMIGGLFRYEGLWRCD